MKGFTENWELILERLTRLKPIGRPKLKVSGMVKALPKGQISKEDWEKRFKKKQVKQKKNQYINTGFLWPKVGDFLIDLVAPNEMRIIFGVAVRELVAGTLSQLI